MKFLVFSFVALIALTGCSNDKAEQGAGLLVGRWLMTSEWDGWVDPDTNREEGVYDPYEPEESFVVEFRADGTGTVWWEMTDPTDISEFRYMYEEDRLLVSGDFVSDDPEAETLIEKLTSTELIMKWYTWIENIDGPTYMAITKAIFRRVD